MKFSWRLFLGIGFFYALITAVYAKLSSEIIGSLALLLSTLLAILLGFYFWFIDRRIVGYLPEDNLEGEIADRAGELGFFSPHSWWPLLVGFFMTLAGLGVLLGWWLTIMAVAGLLISIFGFVMQYQKDKSSY
ncbi:MAG: cytochrome c oxidase subunit 4 [Candidatus Nanopelagicaceae bacterium]|nr:cytochrome c oxidase subunit 4 [Candidatus Nanopelagicaceae bacterium]